MKKIGILGGTFDPIHYGHLVMGDYARAEWPLDEVWYMPTGIPAYKEELHSVTPAVHRAAMTRLAIQGNPFLRYSDMEIKRAGNTYTSDTMLQLHRENPDTEFFYIVGSDSLDYMEEWHEPQIIFANAHILVVGRSTQTAEEISRKKAALLAQFGGQIDILEGDLIRISSTDIREKVARGESITGLVPPAVEEYIRENRLYLQDEGKKGDANG